ncbi:MAG: glycyl-radical enzyme activating protein [Clostridia bacterium]|nr:glycyl-radical enzyme activating protein [Clostridia bacterium]
MKTEITKIQRFSTHDGDGVRTTVFFRGCPLRCPWCHNPETGNGAPKFYYTDSLCIGCGACERVCPAGAHTFGPTHKIDRDKCIGCLACTEACPSNALERCAYSLETDEIIDAVLKDRAFYGDTGGITLSGGEPMAQPDAATELLTMAKSRGITTAMETCGVFPKKYISQLSKICDLFLWDIKDGNAERLKRNTGADLSKILENLYAADALGCVTELRCIMIKGVNMDCDSFSAIAEIYGKIRHCRGIKLLPFHPYGSSKNRRLGQESQMGKEYIPTKADISAAKKFFRSKGVKVL